MMVAKRNGRTDDIFADVLAASLLGLMMLAAINLAAWLSLRRITPNPEDPDPAAFRVLPGLPSAGIMRAHLIVAQRHPVIRRLRSAHDEVCAPFRSFSPASSARSA